LTRTRDAFSPVWSPDGRYIAYVQAPDYRRPPDISEPSGALWIMRAADGRGQRLVATGVLADRISWQPRPRR
jgi:Tol biopolymer transport system component